MKKGKVIGTLSYWKDDFSRWLVRKYTGRALLVNLLLIFLVSAFLIFLVEKGRNPEIKNYGDALWLMIVTMTTVGYGDVVPVTDAGKALTAIAMVLGIGTLSLYVTTRVTKRAQMARKKYRGLEKMVKSGDHIVVCGWNSRGNYMISRLIEEIKGSRMRIILLCDLEESPVDDDAIYFFGGSPDSEADLKRANIAEAKSVILLADEAAGGSASDIDARTVLAALTIRSLNPDIKMTAEVLKPESKHHLELAGVEEILDSNMLLGNLIARSALHFGLINTVNEVVARGSGKHVATIPSRGQIVGMSREELQRYLAEKHGAQLLTIITDEGLSPSDPDYRLVEGDSIIIFSRE